MAIWDAGTNYGRLINEGDLRIGPDSGSRHMWGELINEGTLAVQMGTQLQLNQLFQGQGTLINRPGAQSRWKTEARFLVCSTEVFRKASRRCS